jgi:hypothetical protein
MSWTHSVFVSVHKSDTLCVCLCVPVWCQFLLDYCIQFVWAAAALTQPGTSYIFVLYHPMFLL